MINDQYKFLRIHIKKTGGRSLWGLFPQADDSHAPWGEYYGNLGNKIADYFVWTIVRNPWDRMVSLFFYETYETGLAHTKSFARFIEDMYLPKKFGYGVHYNYDSKPQIDYLTDHTNQLACDYVAYLPNINQDWEKMKKRLGMPSEIMYPHHGANKHEDYRSYYDPLTIEYVRQMYEREIELFGFEFDDLTKFKYPITDLEKEPLQLAWRERLPKGHS